MASGLSVIIMVALLVAWTTAMPAPEDDLKAESSIGYGYAVGAPYSYYRPSYYYGRGYPSYYYGYGYGYPRYYYYY